MTLNWSGKSSILIWLLSSLFFAFAFHRIVYLDFQRELIPVIQSPVSVNPGEDGLNVPFVLDADQRKESRRITIGIRNNSAETRTISAFVNDSTLGTINIPPSRSHKLQVRLSVDREIFERRNRLKLKANGDGWTLERCEIANYFGSSKGILDYIITDKKSLSSVTPSYSLTIAFLLLLIAGNLLIVRASISSRSEVSGHGFSERILRITEKTSRILHLLIFFIFLALIIHPLVTDSRLFLSWWTFLFLVFLAWLPLVGQLYKIVWSVPEQTPLRNSVAGTAVCLLVFLFFIQQWFTLVTSMETTAAFFSFPKGGRNKIHS